MRMVDSMETSYSMYGHTRSLSSIASTILPIASDASTYTSVTASPMEPHDLDTLPIELKIPLPSSSCCSEQDFQAIKEEAELPRNNLSTGDGKSQQSSKDQNQRSPGNETAQDETKNDADRSETSGSTTKSLEELAQLVDLENFQRNRAVSATSQLDQLSIVCGLNQRLRSTMRIAYGNLIDQYKGDDQAGFAGLYDSLEKLKRTCSKQVQIAGGKDRPSDSDFPGEFLVSEDSQPWIQQLPADSQKCALEFLMRIRTDPDFLADRIASLSPSELAALTSSYHPAGVDLSVLANHSHGMTQFYSQDSQMMKLSRRMDNLQRFHDQDPFFTLMYCLFDTTAKAGSLEYARRNDVWSSTCAKVITDRRPGGDELITAGADAFMSFEDWKLKPRIEVYLQTVLAEGSFLLDPFVNTPLNHDESLESKNASHAIRVANFFDKALDDLFNMIASVPHQEAVPRTAQDFLQSTIRKIQDPQLQLKAKQFLVSRWYFASFLSSVLVYPELQGVMMTHHIGDSARRNILKQIVIRMQVQVFDALLPRADDMSVTLERRVQILAISNYFEPSIFRNQSGRPRGGSLMGRIQDAQAHQLMLSHQDVSGLIHTLYPDNPLPEKPANSLTVAQASAPPSTTSSSTLRPGSSDVGSNASSMGPNYSGSSVNSEATITGNALTAPQRAIDNLSHRLSNNAIPAIADVSAADPNDLAWRLWKLHGKLQAITKSGLDNAAESTRPYRWTIFLIHFNGMVSLKPSEPAPGFLASDDSTYQSAGCASDIQTLKEAIVTLLATQDRIQSRSLRTQSPGANQDLLRELLEDALANSRFSMDFGTAHYWHKCLDIYTNLKTSSGIRDNVQSLQNVLGKQLQRSIETCTKQAQAIESTMRSLGFLGKQQKASLSILENQCKALRIKMWYVSDVRHSSTYEEALLVTKALRAMSAPKRNKHPGSTFSWARQRLRGTLSQDRAEAQTLDAMTAPKACGGRSKLADDQAEMTSKWLTRTGIENFCKGEERIHRFCYEVQKSVGRLAGASLLESPVLWSSHLFKREKATFDARTPGSGIVPSLGLHTSLGSFNYGGNRTSLTSTQYSLPPVSSPISVGAHTSSLGYSLGFSTSGLNAFTPPAYPASIPILTGIQSRQSTEANLTATRPEPRHDEDDNFERSPSNTFTVAKEALVQSIKDALYGLLVSDLGYLWREGSETDAWINKAAAQEYIDEKSAIDTVRSSLEVQTGDAQQKDVVENPSGITGGPLDQPNMDPDVNEFSFAFSDAYQTLLHRMSTTYDPFLKLEMLYQLESLVVQSIQDFRKPDSGIETSTPNQPNELQAEPMTRSKSVPRTKATSLEEVIANCTERRAGTFRTSPTLNELASTDAIVNQLLTIFRDHQLRPSNLFLSLQYIAAFVPADTLDHTAHGKAFWDCALAALALKDDLCNSTVRRAAEITNAYITTKPISPPYPSQQEAANLWLVAAKEGSPAAARELGLFYLTHPDLLPQRVTMPLCKSRDVFKSAKASDSGPGGEKERGALDPLTFDVVYHWMEIAANGGDAEAKAFLRQGGSG